MIILTTDQVRSDGQPGRESDETDSEPGVFTESESEAADSDKESDGQAVKGAVRPVGREAARATSGEVIGQTRKEAARVPDREAVGQTHREPARQVNREPAGQTQATMPNNNNNKGATSPWRRLKPPGATHLDNIGLPSKGDVRLLDFKTQERFYTKIVERYMAVCSEAGQRDELLQRFADVQLAAAASVEPSSPPVTPSNSLVDVLGALRKLREGIVATHRADAFAVQAYLFCIRLAILAAQPDAYHPAMLHLLRRMHPRHALSSVELREIVAYLVLDTACRRGDLAEAHALRCHYRLADTKVTAVLHALAHDDALRFWRLKRLVDGHCARIMHWAEQGLRRHALKTLGLSYFNADVAFVERVAGASWSVLTDKYGVGWELDGGKVTIRKPRTQQ